MGYLGPVKIVLVTILILSVVESLKIKPLHDRTITSKLQSGGSPTTSGIVVPDAAAPKSTGSAGSIVPLGIKTGTGNLFKNIS